MTRKKYGRSREPEKFIPHRCKMKYLTLSPNGDAGINTGFNLIGIGLTQHYEAVDDPTAFLPDGYTSYLQPSAPTYYGTESFTFPNHTTQKGKIDYIITAAVVNRATLIDDVSIQFHIWDAGFINIQSGTPIVGISVHPNWQSIGNLFFTNPAGTAWTWSDIDSLIAGFSASSTSLTALNVTQFCIMVHYCE